jgi:hypothetical protein
VRAFGHRQISSLAPSDQISPPSSNSTVQNTSKPSPGAPVGQPCESAAVDRRLRRAARNPGRPSASNARCQACSSSSESEYRREASCMVMAPLLRAARTAALRRATHLLVFGGGRSAINQGCTLVYLSARNSSHRAQTVPCMGIQKQPRLPFGPRHTPPSEPQRAFSHIGSNTINPRIDRPAEPFCD